MRQHYSKNEFCIDIRCPLVEANPIRCGAFGNKCIKTAREFHQWLKDNGFTITKEVSHIEQLKVTDKFM